MASKVFLLFLFIFLRHDKLRRQERSHGKRCISHETCRIGVDSSGEDKNEVVDNGDLRRNRCNTQAMVVTVTDLK